MADFIKDLVMKLISEYAYEYFRWRKSFRTEAITCIEA